MRPLSTVTAFGRVLVEATALIVLLAVTVEGQRLPASSLSVRVGGEWQSIWRADEAPTVWKAADPRMSRAVEWRDVAPGVERAEVSLAGTGLAWRTRLILVRFDPDRIELSLDAAAREGGALGAWRVEAAPAEAIMAFNAGQFRGGRPWGWLVRDGVEVQSPGAGSLGMALVVDRAGTVLLVEPDSIAAARARRDAVQAFQSYPMLLSGNGEVPYALQAPNRGVNVAHRDSRLAVGQLRDGRILVALSRFEGLGGALESLPFGPTIPEMAALMGGLGCDRAMMLDGGLSGQLLLRGPEGSVLTWSGMRRVPLGILARPKR
jgi:hypothetical protein